MTQYLQVSAANLDDLVELLGLRRKRIPKLSERRDERSLDLHSSGDVHSRRETSGESALSPSFATMGGRVRVIAALAHVDMVVRVDGLLRATLATKNFNSTVRDDLTGDG